MLSIASLLCSCTCIPQPLPSIFKKVLDIHSQLPLKVPWPSQVCTTLAGALNDEVNISSVKKTQLNILQTGKMKADCVHCRTSRERVTMTLCWGICFHCPSVALLVLHQLPAWPPAWRTDVIYEGSQSHSKQGTQFHYSQWGLDKEDHRVQVLLLYQVQWGFTWLLRISTGLLRPGSRRMWKSYLSGATWTVWLQMQHGVCMGPCTLPQDSNWRGGDGTSVNLIVYSFTKQSWFFSPCTLLYLWVSYFPQQWCSLLQDCQWALLKASGDEATLWNPTLSKSKRTFDIFLGIIIKYTCLVPNLALENSCIPSLKDWNLI